MDAWKMLFHDFQILNGALLPPCGCYAILGIAKYMYLGKKIWCDWIHSIFQFMIQHGSFWMTCKCHNNIYRHWVNTKKKYAQVHANRIMCKAEAHIWLWHPVPQQTVWELQSCRAGPQCPALVAYFHPPRNIESLQAVTSVVPLGRAPPLSPGHGNHYIPAAW